MNKTFKYTLLSTTILAANAMASTPTGDGYDSPPRSHAGRSAAGAAGTPFSPLVGTPEVHAAAKRAGKYDGTPVTADIRSRLGKADIHERNELKRAHGRQAEQDATARAEEAERRAALLQRIADLDLQAGARDEAITRLEDKVRAITEEKDAASEEARQLSADIEHLTAEAETAAEELQTAKAANAASKAELDRRAAALAEKTTALAAAEERQEATAAERDAVKEERDAIEAERARIEESRTVTNQLLDDARLAAVAKLKEARRNLETVTAQRDAKEKSLQEFQEALTAREAEQAHAAKEAEDLRAQASADADAYNSDDEAGDTAL